MSLKPRYDRVCIEVYLEAVASSKLPALLAERMLVVDSRLVSPRGEGRDDPALEHEQPADVDRTYGGLDLVVPRGGLPAVAVAVVVVVAAHACTEGNVEVLTSR